MLSSKMSSKLRQKQNEGKKKYDAKRKKHVPIKPSTGHVSKAILSF